MRSRPPQLGTATPGRVDPEAVDRLLVWSRDALRDLPWRATRDPWAILVSELMLQQTQVARVIPRYHEFLQDLPDPAACAAASPAAVIERWQGLGYNRRAVNLHRAAVAIVERHGGAVPSTLDELLALPGVGPYTARAVLAFAFERDDVGVLDTNVGRVLARHTAGRPLGRADAQAIADASVPTGDGWAWNQAVMELGATVCRRRAPACDSCPVAGTCAWRRAGRPSPDPADGSAGTGSRQSTFEGSDRQGRGRLVDALRDGPVPLDELAATAGWPQDADRAHRVAETLVADGLAVRDGQALRLPV